MSFLHQTLFNKASVENMELREQLKNCTCKQHKYKAHKLKPNKSVANTITEPDNTAYDFASSNTIFIKKLFEKRSLSVKRLKESLGITKEQVKQNLDKLTKADINKFKILRKRSNGGYEWASKFSRRSVKKDTFSSLVAQREWIRSTLPDNWAAYFMEFELFFSLPDKKRDETAPAGTQDEKSSTEILDPNTNTKNTNTAPYATEHLELHQNETRPTDSTIVLPPLKKEFGLKTYAKKRPLNNNTKNNKNKRPTKRLKK